MKEILKYSIDQIINTGEYKAQVMLQQKEKNELIMETDVESSIYNKLQETEVKLSKEEIHHYLDTFIKSKGYKVAVIK